MYFLILLAVLYQNFAFEPHRIDSIKHFKCVFIEFRNSIVFIESEEVPIQRKRTSNYIFAYCNRLTNSIKDHGRSIDYFNVRSDFGNSNSIFQKKFLENGCSENPQKSGSS